MDVFLLIIIIIAVIVAISKYETDKKKANSQEIYVDVSLGPGSTDSEQNYKKYTSLDDWEKDIEIIWSGKPRIIEFTYEKYGGEKSRRKLELMQILKNNNGSVYLRGICQLRNEERTFDVMRIETKILDKSKRYEIPEWFYEKLKIDFP